MNIRKIAVFVEGQTEYIFVRDFLCAWYEFDANKLGLECYQSMEIKKIKFLILMEQETVKTFISFIMWGMTKVY